MKYISFDDFCRKNNIEPGSDDSQQLEEIINSDQRWKSKHVNAEWTLWKGLNDSNTWKISEDAKIEDIKQSAKSTNLLNKIKPKEDTPWYLKLIGYLILLIIVLLCFLIHSCYNFIRTLILSISSNNTKGVILSAIGAALTSSIIAFIISFFALDGFDGDLFTQITVSLIPCIVFLSVPCIYGIYRLISSLISREQKPPKQIITTIGLCLVLLICIGGLITGDIILSNMHHASDHATTTSSDSQHTPRTEQEAATNAPTVAAPAPKASIIPTNQPLAATSPAVPTPPSQNGPMSSGMVAAPSVVNVAPNAESRLKFVKSIKDKKKKIEYLVFQDSYTNSECLVAMQSEMGVLSSKHWCIPYSGSVQSIDNPLISTQTHQYAPLTYPYCFDLIKMGSFMPGGLATFFENFTPNYYNTKLRYFAENADIDVYQLAENLDFDFDPYNTWDVPDKYFKSGLSVVMDVSFNNPEPGLMSQWEWQSLPNKNKLFFIERQDSHPLHKDDVILTASAKKGEKKFHQYWLVASDRVVYARVYSGRVLRPGEENELPIYGIPVVPIYDLHSKEIWNAQSAQIAEGIRAKDAYCLQALQSLQNEAAVRQWATIPDGSSLLKKK